MKPACQISAEALRVGGEAARGRYDGSDRQDHLRLYRQPGARPNFKGLGGFGQRMHLCERRYRYPRHSVPWHRAARRRYRQHRHRRRRRPWLNGDNAATRSRRSFRNGAALMDVTKEALMRGHCGRADRQPCGRHQRGGAAVRRTPAFPSRTYVGHGVGRELHRRPGGAELRHGGRGPRVEWDGACHRTDGKRKNVVKTTSDGWTTNR